MKNINFKKLAHLFLVITALTVSSLSYTALNVAEAQHRHTGDDELDDLEVQR
jgi:hypothetical protein